VQLPGLLEEPHLMGVR